MTITEYCVMCGEPMTSCQCSPALKPMGTVTMTLAPGTLSAPMLDNPAPAPDAPAAREEEFECDCASWKENMPKIDGPIVTIALRYNTSGYDGEPFRFCPWCAASLARVPVEGER